MLQRTSSVRFDENPGRFLHPWSCRRTRTRRSLTEGRWPTTCTSCRRSRSQTTLVGSVRIADKVTKANKKDGGDDESSLQPVQDDDCASACDRGRYGDLNYLVFRFTQEARQLGGLGIRVPLRDGGSAAGGGVGASTWTSWPTWLGAKCDTIYARTWNPTWSAFAGDAPGAGDDGVRERRASHLRGLQGERRGAGRLGPREHARRVRRGDAGPRIRTAWSASRSTRRANARIKAEGDGDTVPWLEQPFWGPRVADLRSSLRWLEGGEAMETNVLDNLQSVALVTAAIEKQPDRDCR